MVQWYHVLAVNENNELAVTSTQIEGDLDRVEDSLKKRGYTSRVLHVKKEEDLNPLTAEGLLQLVNFLKPKGPDVKRFSTRAAGLARAWKLLSTRKDVDEETPPENPTTPAAPTSSDAASAVAPTTQPVGAASSQETEDMAKKAKKTKKVSKPREHGKPAKKVSDFKQVREGSVRASILKLMDGTHTAEKIGEMVKQTTTMVNAHAYCLWRDCGIGYHVDEAGKLKALYPTGKSYKDAVKKSEKAA